MSGGGIIGGAGGVVIGDVNAAIATHAAAADPHTGYQKESEKGAASGYASLDVGATVPDAQIPVTIARDAETTSAIAAEATARDAAIAAAGVSAQLITRLFLR